MRNCTLQASSDFNHDGLKMHHPWTCFLSLLLALFFLPAIAFGHNHGVPRKFRAVWAWMVGSLVALFVVHAHSGPQTVALGHSQSTDCSSKALSVHSL